MNLGRKNLKPTPDGPSPWEAYKAELWVILAASIPKESLRIDLRVDGGSRE